MNETKTAAVAYNAALADACSAMGQIQANMTAHARDQIDHGNWGHVGDMRHVATQLQRIADQFRSRGEQQHAYHAAEGELSLKETAKR